MNYKLASHDSGTGEPSKCWYHKLLIPFAKTQSKSLKEQFDTGVRLFDIRIDKYFNIAHGIWKSSTNLWTALNIINECAITTKERTYVSITYEGRLNNESDRGSLIYAYNSMIMNHSNDYLKFHSLSVKYGRNSKGIAVKYDVLQQDYPIPTKQCFKALDGTSWHTIIPIPWLWYKIYVIKPNDNTYNYYDFV